MNSGEARLLTALLLVDNPRLVNQTALALYNIVSEMEDSQLVISENGYEQTEAVRMLNTEI